MIILQGLETGKSFTVTGGGGSNLSAPEFQLSLQYLLAKLMMCKSCSRHDVKKV